MTNIDGTRKAHLTTTVHEGEFVQIYYITVKTTLMPRSHEFPGQFTGPVRVKTMGIRG